jgi:transcriptional regulator with XRE-family HTH domain
MYTTFGEKLRKLMKARSIKAIKLAQKMGVSCAYISQLITGIRRPGRETLLKLSRALEVPVETLIMIEADPAETVLISRRIPVLDETKMQDWADVIDLDYPAFAANSFEYATTDDPNAFYVTPGGLVSCCGLDSCDLILIEPNKPIGSGDMVLACSSEGISIKKIVIQDTTTILLDEKKEPSVFTKENLEGTTKFYRVSQCLRKF